jgi:hypothetical protein
MAEAKTCAACGQAVSVGDYRTAGARDAVPVEKKPKAPHLVLEEEFREADRESGNWFAAAVGTWSAVVLFAAWAASTDVRAPDVLGAGCGVAAVFFTFGCLRCRTTVRAWRDQKRGKALGG